MAAADSQHRQQRDSHASSLHGTLASSSPDPRAPVFSDSCGRMLRWPISIWLKLNQLAPPPQTRAQRRRLAPAQRRAPQFGRRPHLYDLPDGLRVGRLAHDTGNRNRARYGRPPPTPQRPSAGSHAAEDTEGQESQLRRKPPHPQHLRLLRLQHRHQPGLRRSRAPAGPEHGQGAHRPRLRRRRTGADGRARPRGAGARRPRHRHHPGLPFREGAHAARRHRARSSSTTCTSARS